jgi:putative hydrolase of the HAD superfamily
MIRAVIFDIGGPLDVETRHEASIDDDIKTALQREGYVVDDEAYAAAEAWAVEHFAPSAYRATIWQLTNGDEAISRRVYDWMESRGQLRDFFDLRDGIVPVLSDLKSRGLKLGLAANQPLRALAQLKKHGLGSYFDNEGISAVYGFRKPDIRLFVRVCEDLDVTPSDCIMVGDRIDNDIVPAKLLGMRTVLFRTGRHRNQQPRSWDEIPDFEVEDVYGLKIALMKLLDATSDQKR